MCGRNILIQHLPVRIIDRGANDPSPVPSASAIHGKVVRKRAHVSSRSVPLVFVVDDEQVIASTLAAILNLHGYSATPFTSPLDALTAARVSAPDLLISDVVMPALSGVDLAIRIKAECPACKILLFSGQATTRDLLKGAQDQRHNFQLLQKPVDPSVMVLRVRALVMESGLGLGCIPAQPAESLPRILQMRNSPSTLTACHAYQLLKRGYESAMREVELYERGDAASMQQTNRHKGEARAQSAAASNYLAAHSENCPVCKGSMQRSDARQREGKFSSK
jgi:DNA-binding response OmpR family regulator